MARLQDPIPDRRIPDHLIPRQDTEADSPNEAKAEVQDEDKTPEPSPPGPAEAPKETETGPETASTADFPVVPGDPAPRRGARALQVEARRDARRRKLDRRRA